MSIFEYNEEEEIKKIRASERRSAKVEGKIEGKSEDLIAILSCHGEVSQEIKDKIQQQKEPQKLQEWIVIAATTRTIEEFVDKAF